MRRNFSPGLQQTPHCGQLRLIVNDAYSVSGNRIQHRPRERAACRWGGVLVASKQKRPVVFTTSRHRMASTTVGAGNTHRSFTAPCHHPDRVSLRPYPWSTTLERGC